MNAASRAAQGLPERVEDPVVIGRVVVLLRAVPMPQEQRERAA